MTCPCAQTWAAYRNVKPGNSLHAPLEFFYLMPASFFLARCSRTDICVRPREPGLYNPGLVFSVGSNTDPRTFSARTTSHVVIRQARALRRLRSTDFELVLAMSKSLLLLPAASSTRLAPAPACLHGRHRPAVCAVRLLVVPVASYAQCAATGGPLLPADDALAAHGAHRLLQRALLFKT